MRVKEGGSSTIRSNCGTTLSCCLTAVRAFSQSKTLPASKEHFSARSFAAALRAAAAMACVDLAAGRDDGPTGDEIRAALARDYGMDSARPLPSRVSEQFSRLVAEARTSGATGIRGPRWCPVGTFPARRAPAVAASTELTAAVTAEGTLWLGDFPGNHHQR